MDSYFQGLNWAYIIIIQISPISDKSPKYGKSSTVQTEQGKQQSTMQITIQIWQIELNHQIWQIIACALNSSKSH